MPLLGVAPAAPSFAAAALQASLCSFHPVGLCSFHPSVYVHSTRRFVFIPSVGLCSFHPSVCVHSIRRFVFIPPRRFVFIPSVGLCSFHPSVCVHSTRRFVYIPPRRFVFIPPVGLASVHSVTKYRYATSSAPRCFGAAITVSTMSTLLFSLHRRLCSFSTR